MKTLKKILPIICCLFVFQLSAQFSIGVKGGFTKAWEEYGDIGLPDDANISVKGYHVSGLAYYQINKHFSVGVEPGFTKRGAACEPGFLIFAEDTKLYLDYVELPLMGAFNYPFFKNRIELFGKVGYGVSAITKAMRERRSIVPEEPVIKEKVVVGDGDNSFDRWDHGLYSGVGIGVNFGVNQVFVETNYYLGMNDIEPNNTSKNRTTKLGIGYRIRF